MSSQSFENYLYVIGIDFGGITSGISLAHKNDSFKIHTIDNWSNTSKLCSQVPTSILYKSGNIEDEDNIAFGLEITENKISENDIHIQYIKQYIFDIARAKVELKRIHKALTIQKVVADYLKKIHKSALRKLEEDTKFKSNSTLKDFKVENSRYCLACPRPQQKFMSQCFILAGIITEDEVEYRLEFITEAEATAYNCLAWDRLTSQIHAEQQYLVCDIGHSSIGISKILADTTESLSNVELVSENPGMGSMTLENNLRNYLENNHLRLNLNTSIIEAVVKEFVENIKFSFDATSEDIFSADVEKLKISGESSSIHSSVFVNRNNKRELIDITKADLNKYVFSPAIKDIVDCILEADSKSNYKKVFLSGRYGSDSHFIGNLAFVKNRKLLDYITLIDHMPIDAVSRGAVSFGLRKRQSQIPYFLNRSNESSVKIESKEIVPKVDNCDFIVSIDFGTTHSGSSYARPDDQIIKPITTDWPGQFNNTYEKAPTLLIYNGKKKKILSTWGQNAKDHDLKKDELLFGNFKLFLSPESVKEFYGEGNEDISHITEKFTLDSVTAVDVIADYLKYFKKHVSKHIKDREAKRGIFMKEKLKLSYVLTVPAMWDRTAKDTMVCAAVKGGIVKENELENLLIITEPEAAALYCERYYTDFLKKDGTTFIVCDAGGGTVDLVTFRLDLQKDEITGADTNEYMICQIDKGEGDTCGSTYLDDRFKKYILKFYEDIGVQLDETKLSLDSVMTNFIENLKPEFEPCPSRDLTYLITLPSYPKIPEGVNTFKRTTNRNRVLKMPYEDMETKVFNPIMERIENLLDSQISKAEGRKIDTILLVGGFSKSKYLQTRLKKRYSPDITIGVPADAVTSISQGAVSYAQKPRMVSRKLVGQSYALEVQAIFDRNKFDPFEKRVEGSDGEKYSKSRLIYFAKKNDQVQERKTSIYEKIVHVEYPKNAVIAIFSSEEQVDENDTKWRYVNKDLHTKIMEVKIDMPILLNKIINDKIPFKISLQLNHIGGVTVSIECLVQGSNLLTTSSAKTTGDTLKYVRKSEPVVMRSKVSKKSPRSVGGYVLPSK